MKNHDYSTAEGQRRLMAESMGHDYIPTRRIDTRRPGDYGADPVGDGTFRMIPSGDIASLDERNERLSVFSSRPARV